MAERRSAVSAMESTNTSLAAAGPPEVLASLQLLLQVEYLLSALYANAAAATGLVPTTDVQVYTTLNANSAKHLSLITALIEARAGAPAPSPTFDFTVKGAFPGFAFAAGQYATLQMLSQVGEDLAVRAYLGQIAVLASDKGALTTVVSIFTVKGRHASEVRRLRGKLGWITSNSRDDLPLFAQAVYDGEDNVQQGTVNIASIPGGFGDAGGATQAFDEPLTNAQVTAILNLFV